MQKQNVQSGQKQNNVQSGCKVGTCNCGHYSWQNKLISFISPP
uniref:Uncharacterized protein n=1 Tax=Manihot esculenta TaxID=3983 RepID=A0A2C9UQ88_MANES